MSRSRSTSSGSRFDIEAMPVIHRRSLHDYSVHCSPSTSKWIATILRGGDVRRTLQHSFKSEREARRFAKSFCPPKMRPESRHCQICNTGLNGKPAQCRNCGVCICENCSLRWGGSMVPRTYLSTTSLTVRVCSSCDWLSNAFCIALLQGRADDAKLLCDTGNVNLRSSFAAIHGEAMFPVHCAVMGGNLAILKWLVDGHCCPIAVRRDQRSKHLVSVQTSEDRSLVDLALTGKPKLDILRYLVMEKSLSVTDTKDSSLVPKALEALLRAGIPLVPTDNNNNSSRRTASPVEDGLVHIVADDDVDVEESLTTLDDACIICCSQPMNSVLTPCGHQVCCDECGKSLQRCPVCKADCSVLRIFRM